MELPKKEKISKTAVHSAKYRVMKRLRDIFLGILLVIVLSPLYLYICIVVYKREGRPVVHRTKQDGFTLWQFRTMSNPSRLITALPPYPPGRHRENVRWDRHITMTATGIWLKRYKLDKLPLLFHLIKGDVDLLYVKKEFTEDGRSQNNWQ